MFLSIVKNYYVKTAFLFALAGFALGAWVDIWANQGVYRWIRGEGFFTIWGTLIGCSLGIFLVGRWELKYEV